MDDVQKSEDSFLSPDSRTNLSESTYYSKKKQLLAAFSTTLGCLLNGCVIGYTGPALPSLMSNATTITNQTLPFQLQEASWVTSTLSVGCFVGCIMAVPLMEKIGRKQTLLYVSTGNYILGFVFILIANKVYFLYIGRFLNGLGLGLVLSTVSVYIVEIASDDMKGLLGCLVQLQGTIGILLTFCIGSAVSWWQLAIAHLILVVPFFTAMSMVPESPHWLIMKGKEWQAEVSLKWLRGRNPTQLDREIEMIKRNVAVTRRERQSIMLLSEPEVLKPFMVSIVMMLFLQLSGLNVVVFYCGTIFQISRSSISPGHSNIIVGVVLMTSGLVALGVVTRFKRRSILLFSMTGMLLSHAALGSYFYIQSLNESSIELSESFSDSFGQSLLEVVPLVAVTLLLFIGNTGYGTLIWVVTAEMIPLKVRSVASSLIISFAFVTSFLTTKSFADLVQAVGLDGTFWIYSGFCAIGIVFTFISVPETKNKTIEEIQCFFKTNDKLKTENQHPLDTVS